MEWADLKYMRLLQTLRYLKAVNTIMGLMIRAQSVSCVNFSRWFYRLLVLPPTLITASHDIAHTASLSPSAITRYHISRRFYRLLVLPPTSGGSSIRAQEHVNPV